MRAIKAINTPIEDVTVRGRFFVVARLDGRCSAKVRHATYGDAHAEATRLAAAEPGTEFFVLKACDSWTAQSVVTIKCAMYGPLEPWKDTIIAQAAR